jgi:hypothetical protein
MSKTAGLTGRESIKGAYDLLELSLSVVSSDLACCAAHHITSHSAARRSSCALVILRARGMCEGGDSLCELSLAWRCSRIST